MDSIRSFVSDNPTISTQVENVYNQLYEHYANLTPGQYQVIRQTLLSFFQDMHIRVSIFLKDKVQSANGRFVLATNGEVPWDTEVPGLIRYLDEQGHTTSTASFDTSCHHHLPDKPGSFELLGDRVTKLGTNMYVASRPVLASSSTTNVASKKLPTPPVATTASMQPEPASSESPNPMAKAELNLLAHLVGGGTGKPSEGQTFRLNLFNTDEEEKQAAVEAKTGDPHRVITIDATKKQQRQELTQLMDEFSFESSGAQRDKGDELLDLMDQA